MSTPSESVDELAPPLKLPPTNDVEIPPSNDVTPAANVEDEAKIKKNRNRRKNHGQKGAAKNAESNNTDNRPKQEESTNEGVENVETADGEKENAEKKARKRRPKPKATAQDQTSQVKTHYRLDLINGQVSLILNTGLTDLLTSPVFRRIHFSCRGMKNRQFCRPQVLFGPLIKRGTIFFHVFPSKNAKYSMFPCLEKLTNHSMIELHSNIQIPNSSIIRRPTVFNVNLFNCRAPNIKIKLRPYRRNPSSKNQTPILMKI